MVQIFYGDLSPSSRTLVNTAARGSFFQKTKDDCVYGDNGQQVNFVNNNRPTYQNANNYHTGARNNHPNLA